MNIEDILRDISSDSADSEEELLQLKKNSDHNSCKNVNSFHLEPSEKSSSLMTKLCNLNWKHIAIMSCLWLAYLLCNMSYSIVGPFFPHEAEEKGASALIVGIIIGCAPLSLVLCSPAVGYLLPVTGILMPTFTGLLLVGASYIILGLIVLIPSLWGFISLAILLRLVEGAGSAMVITTTYAIIPKLFPQHISTMVGVMEVAAGFGYALGPAVGGGLYKAGGYKTPFLTMGGLVLALLVPCALLVWKVEIDTRDREILPIKTVLRISFTLTINVLAMAIILAYTCFGFFETTLQPFLIKEFDMPNEYIGLILCTGAFAYLMSALVLGPIVDKVGHNRWFIPLGLIITASSYFVMGLTKSVITGQWYILILCVSFLFTGIGASFSVIPVYSDMLKVTKRYSWSKTESPDAVAAFVSGLISSSLFLGEFVGALIGGMLTDHLSFPESAVIVGEFLPAEALLLIGVTIIDKYTMVHSTKKK